MPRIERDRELARRRKRKVKLQKLEGKFAKATSAAEKAEIAAKVRRFSPMINLEVRLEERKAAVAAKK
jgi:hypothetical protein